VSYDVLAVAVDLDKVTAVVGSNDLQLVAQLAAEFADELAQAEELQEDVLDEELGPYPAAEALRDLIAGGPYRDDAGLSYYFCFEIICWHFGDTMDNDAWMHFDSGWFDEVEAGLQQAGVLSLSLTSLIYRGPPVELPEPPDYPTLATLRSPRWRRPAPPSRRLTCRR
jgi:hypothetical protein